VTNISFIGLNTDEYSSDDDMTILLHSSLLTQLNRWGLGDGRQSLNIWVQTRDEKLKIN